MREKILLDIPRWTGEAIVATYYEDYSTVVPAAVLFIPGLVWKFSMVLVFTTRVTNLRFRLLLLRSVWLFRIKILQSRSRRIHLIFWEMPTHWPVMGLFGDFLPLKKVRNDYGERPFSTRGLFIWVLRANHVFYAASFYQISLAPIPCWSVSRERRRRSV